MDKNYLRDDRKRIITEIQDIIDIINSTEYVDEYIYILLWRPIEWIIDYYALERKYEQNSSITIEEFLEGWNEKTVDEKVKTETLGKSFFDESIWQMVDNLRWFRNVTIHHRKDIEANTQVFSDFMIICNDYLSRTGETINEHINSMPDIVLSKYASAQEMNGTDVDVGLFYETYSYLKSPDAVSLFSILKMEYLAQRFAYSLLIERGCKIEYNKGIYINQNETDSYIDYYTSDKFKSYKSEAITKKNLRILRDSRNCAIHTVESGNEIIDEYTSVWFLLMQEYYCDEQTIQSTIAKELEGYKYASSVSLLESFIETYNKFLPRKMIVDIKGVLIPALSTEMKLKQLKMEYSEKLDEATEDEKEQIIAEMNLKLDESFNQILKKQSVEKISEYREKIYEFLEGYGPYLGEVSINYLITAFSLREALEENSFLGFDYAGVCIEFTRSIEKYLYEKVFERFCSYVRNHSDEEDKLNDYVRKRVNKNKIMLGDYQKIWGVEKGYDSSGDVYNSFCRQEHMYNNKVDDELKDLLIEEADLIKMINENYRIKSAHRYEVDECLMDKCVVDILTGDNAVLKKLLVDMEERRTVR